jgi:D-arginine dehydrogenase
MSSSPSVLGLYDAAIVGAGIAGASALYHLTRRGLRCILLEREPLAGMHATGRSAAMIRQNVADPVERLLAQRSAAFYADPQGFTAPLEFRRTGSLVLFADDATAHGRDAELGAVPLLRRHLTPSEARAMVPLLDATPFGSAELCTSDGVVDVAGLLQGYLQAAIAGGSEVRLRTRVGVPTRRESGGFRIDSELGVLEAERIIDAAGAWCGEIAAALGSSIGAPLQPMRRHLFVTGPLAWVDPRWPFTWDEGNGFYFRPESSGLLFCPCDERRSRPGDVGVDAAIEELAIQKIARFLPRLLDASFRYGWAGQRTFAADHRSLVGSDPDVPGLYWIGGLGGHGVSTAHEVGRLLALAATDAARGEDAVLLARLRPGRASAMATAGEQN